MILVTGVNGQLGYDVVKELKNRNIECIGVGRKDFDITDEQKTKNFIKNVSPEAIIHCAAYTAVDKAEDEPELCEKVNALGTKFIAEACKDIGAKMIYISTDYVFSGELEGVYTTKSIPKPLNIYGKSKLSGESFVKKYITKFFIVRTSWVYGINGNNFVKKMIEIGKYKDEISIVCDQIGSPTYSVDLSKLLCDMVFTEKYGIYNATNEGYCSWAEFAKEIFKYLGYDNKINFILTKDYNAKALRPLNSKLDKKCLLEAGFNTLPYWKDSLKVFLNEVRLNETV